MGKDKRTNKRGPKGLGKLWTTRVLIGCFSVGGGGGGDHNGTATKNN